MKAVRRSAGERCGREDEDRAADDDDDADADDDDDNVAVDAAASSISARNIATSRIDMPPGCAISRCVNSTKASSSERPNAAV